MLLPSRSHENLLGDAEIAVERFQQAVEATPENAESHFNLAVTLNSKFSKHVLAIKHCRLAMKYEPNMHKAYHLMGNILQDIGKQEEAVRYFTLAERIASNLSLNDDEPSATESNSSSTSAVYQNLWIWTAQIGHTYIFERIGLDWQRRYLQSETDILSSSSDKVRNDVQTLNLLEMRCISERPLLFEISQLLTNEECDHILSRAEPLLQSSHVMGEGARSSSPSDTTSEPYRRSANAWLSRDEVLIQMQSRVSLLSGLPFPYVQIMSEDLQVIKYDSNGQFKLHQDSSQFHPRLLTALVYLQDSDDDAATGGETWFPFAPGSKHRNENEDQLTSIDEALASIQSSLHEEERFPERTPERGAVVKPRKGKAVLFFNHLPDGRIDPAALHSGRKLLEGTKWAANYWIKFDTGRLEHIVSSS
jgi:tetratricopeptide (TPR) repeat protein